VGDSYRVGLESRANARGRALINVTPDLFNITEGNGTQASKVFLDTNSGGANIATTFTLGSTSTIDGNVSIGLPGRVSATVGGISQATAITGAAYHPVTGNSDATGAYFNLFNTAGAVNATNPITFTTGDIIKLTGTLYTDSVTI
jgi:hypothetical protein